MVKNLARTAADCSAGTATDGCSLGTADAGGRLVLPIAANWPSLRATAIPRGLPQPPQVQVQVIAPGDRLQITVLPQGAGSPRVIDTFALPTRFGGVDYPAGAALTSPARGFGLSRNTPALRRMLDLVQLVLDPADPVNYAQHWSRDLLAARTDSEEGRVAGPANALVIGTSGYPVVPISTTFSLARAAGLVELTRPNPAYGVSIDQVLVRSGASEGIAATHRFDDPSGGLLRGAARTRALRRRRGLHRRRAHRSDRVLVQQRHLHGCAAGAAARSSAAAAAGAQLEPGHRVPREQEGERARMLLDRPFRLRTPRNAGHLCADDSVPEPRRAARLRRPAARKPVRRRAVHGERRRAVFRVPRTRFAFRRMPAGPFALPLDSTPALSRSAGPKAPGRSAEMRVRTLSPPAAANTTGASGAQNSASTWRHPPHGAAGRSAPPTTATASMRRSPAATAIATALRSAQTESG